MTPEEKMKRLSPSHDHFELVADPWHVDAFAGMIQPNDKVAAIGFGKGEEVPHRGVRRKVWYSVDWCGNLIQEWGEDTPPGH